MRALRFASLVAAALLISTLLAADHARAQSDDELKAANERIFALYRAGKYAEATPLAEQAAALAERALGPDKPRFGGALVTLGTIYRAQGRYADAEPRYKRALAIFEKALGPDNLNVAVALTELAQLYTLQGRLADAEPLYKRALDIDEKVYGPDHAEVATVLNNLAALYRAQGRYGLAEQLRKRTIAILEKVKGPDDPQVAIALDNLAVLYQSQGRFDLARPLAERALGILEKALGPDHPDVATTLNNLATLYIDLRRYEAAEPLFKRSVASNERTLGPNHLEVAKTLDNFAGLYRIQGKYAEAAPVYQRALTIFESNLGPDHPDVGVFYGNFGGFYFDQEDWATSLGYLRKAADLLMRRSRRGLDTIGQALSGRGRAEAARNSLTFIRLVKAAHRQAGKDPQAAAELAAEAFAAAQWARASEAAASLAQMAVRSAAGDRGLALLVRERQDLLDLWQKRNGLLVWARSQPPEKRSARVDLRIQEDLALIDKRLADIDRELRQSFPQFASLSSPESLSVGEVQTWLHRDEALLLFLDTRELEPYLDTPAAKPMPEETYLWVVTKTGTRWVRGALGTKALAAHVSALRCGLDHTLWQSPDSARACETALSTRPGTERVTAGAETRKVQVLPFDLARAHELYTALLGPVEELIKSKHLLVVPSGALTSLPFHVLVTEPPQGEGTLADYRRAAWLGARQATTVLPSVASLKALREVAKTSHATKPYFGVGNPLLDGPQDDPKWGDHHKREAQAARDRQQCSTTRQLHVASAAGRPRAPFASLFRGLRADIEHVRHLTALPETADELCEVSRRLGAPETEVLLGSRASEGALKDLSEQGRLAEYAILHFATHGALTGQVQGAAEPGLILTPPAAGTADLRALERDDGYLAASEIAALKLDADWVILSACNTAGPSTGAPDASGENAEALSGLARAFFYAGARALLVSHWEVGSHAAVKLTTGAFAALKAKPAIGRSEALRISMRALIENGEGLEAHPAQWAPFVVVGEGGAQLQTASLPTPSPADASPKGPPPKEPPAATPARAKPKSTKKTNPPDWQSDLWGR